MKSHKVIFVLALVCSAIGFERPMLSQQAPAAAAAVSPQRALLNQYCVTCHNDKMKANFADISFEKADVDHVAVDPALWEKAVYKLRASPCHRWGSLGPTRLLTMVFASG
jgi:hypothetical protein